MKSKAGFFDVAQFSFSRVYQETQVSHSVDLSMASQMFFLEQQNDAPRSPKHLGFCKGFSTCSDQIQPQNVSWLLCFDGWKGWEVSISNLKNYIIRDITMLPSCHACADSDEFVCI